VRVAQLLAAALEEGMLALKMNVVGKALSGVADIRRVRDVCIK
jgi:hypothetical protein